MNSQPVSNESVIVSRYNDLRRKLEAGKWDPRTELYQPYDAEQILLNENANTMALKAYLKMSQLPFSVVQRANAEYMSPTGKIPFVRCGQYVIAELEPILEFIETKTTCEMLSHFLKPEEKSDMFAYMALVNGNVANVERYLLWCDPVVLPLTYERFTCVYPFPLGYVMFSLKKRAIRSLLKATKWLHKRSDEVIEEFDACCKSLSTRLGDRQYFFGSSPTELDALVFGHLYTIITTNIARNDLQLVVRQYSNLVDLCRRVEEQYFPTKKMASRSNH